MQIDLSSIDKERFNVEVRQHPALGEVVLITPNAAMFDWRLDELHLRSLVLRASDGFVISAGFPKFFNHSEVPELDAECRLGLLEQRTKFTSKVDGSLIIRSVVHGQVYLRTRGYHMLATDFETPVMELIQQKHPKILDPSWGQACNLLYEYTAPSNQIVIRYDEPGLTALALTAFQDDGKLHVYRFPESFAALCGTPRVEEVATIQSVDDIAFALAKLERQEGFVTWTELPDASFLLTKFKTPWYLKLHALRSQASPRFIKEYCVRHEIASLEGFKTQLAVDGFDFETVNYLAPSFLEFMSRKAIVDRTVQEFETVCANRGVSSSLDRKTLALTLKEIAAELGQDWLFGYGINTFTGKPGVAAEMCLAQLLDIGVNEFRALKKTWHDAC